MKIIDRFMSPKAKFVCYITIGACANAWHLWHSLTQAAHTPAPQWIIQKLTPWMSGGNPQIISAGECLANAAVGIVGFGLGVSEYYLSNPGQTFLALVTAYHLIKARREWREFRENEALEQANQQNDILIEPTASVQSISNDQKMAT